jgi:hypothetical protein
VSTSSIDVKVDLLTLTNIWWSNIKQNWRVVSAILVKTFANACTLNSKLLLGILDFDVESELIASLWLPETRWQKSTIEVFHGLVHQSGN